jgi:PAS domain S-box-containing protein
MRKAAGREAAGKKKSRKAEQPKKTAGKRSSPKPARSGAFDADALLNSMDGMVFVASFDYRIEYMNEAARRKIGRDMTGKHCFTVFHGLQKRCPWCMGEHVLQGQTVRQEIQGQLDKRWYSNVITPLYRKDGTVAIQALVFDITDQRQAQAALVQNEAILRSIHQAAPMGIGVVKSRVLDWTNEQISRMTGYTAEELRGKSARIFYADDEEFDRVGRHKYAEIRSKGTGSIVTVWRCKDGRLINVYLSSTPIDPGDLLAGVVFMALDITEKKKAQDELWRSEEKFQTLFENAVMGIFQSTPEGRFITINPAGAKMCGFDSPEEMTAAITDIATQHYVDPAERDLFIRAIEQQGFIKNFEHRTFRKDGSVFWVSVNARAVKDRRGNIIYYEGTHEDIQWRKEAEEALRASEERFSKAFRSNPAPVAISTIDEGRFIEVNDRFLEAFGYRRDDIIGRTSADLDFWASAETRGEVLKKLRETGSVKNVLNHYKTKSGQLRTGLWSGEIVRLGNRDVLLSILHDITERKIAEEKYQSILADIEEFYYETDLGGNLTFFNDAACNIIGYTREELQGKNNRDYTAPETAKRMYRVFNSVYRTGEKKKISDYEVIRKDGSRRVLEILTTLKRDERGEPSGFRGLGRDVTDRVKAEEKLRQSEEKYRHLFENSLVGVFQSSLKGRYISVNPAFAKIHGYESPADVISSVTNIGTQIFVDEEDRKRCIAILQETGILEQFETRTRRKDGSIIWTIINSRIVRDSDGRPLFIEGVIEDITERKNAVEALRASEERFIKVFQSNPIPMTITTIDEGRLIDVNERTIELSGYSREEMLGRTSNEIGLWACPEERDRLIAILRKTGSLRDGMAHFRTKAGDVRPALWSADAIQLGEKKVLLTAIQDITERKRAEETRLKLEAQLRQAQKMEAVGTLAGGIAHDFNNILFAVIGYAELCLQDIQDEETRWNLSQILSACSRAKSLVNQILAFSRQVEQERRPLDVVPLAKEAVKFLRSSLPVTVDLSLDANARNSIILGDATQIHQVIMNLSTNAAHAMRTSGGQLRITIDNAAPPSEAARGDEKNGRPEGFVHLAVSDTGHGIEPDHLNRIFDPFFTTKAPGEGTGLGLSVVYGIVKNLGGTIHVESTAGRGSTFDIYLPAVVLERTEPAGAAEPLPRGTESILFVDDEGHLVEVMERMLSVLGYRVITVMDSSKALTLFRDNPESFDLVITDMTMPGMTGAELAREILQRRPDIPIILCTGYSDLINEQEALEMGIRRFLMKPLFMGNVAREIRTVLDEHGRRPAS